jgi:hypothetical protein
MGNPPEFSTQVKAPDGEPGGFVFLESRQATERLYVLAELPAHRAEQSQQAAAEENYTARLWGGGDGD